MTGYWPSSAHACGFWFLPTAWQFSCDKCLELSRNMNSSLGSVLCAKHSSMEHFLVGNSYSSRPVFVGLSSIGRCVSCPICICIGNFYSISLLPVHCNESPIHTDWNYDYTHQAICHSQILFLNIKITYCYFDLTISVQLFQRVHHAYTHAWKNNQCTENPLGCQVWHRIEL